MSERGEYRPHQMHLGVFVNAAGNHVSGWRLPGAFTSSENFPDILDIVRSAEQGKLDFVFFADSPNSSLDGPPGFMLQFEPTTLLAALSVSTSRIGLVATISSTFTEPYNLARAVASLEQLSGGRVGWNVVTTASQEAAANFGRELPHHDHRYEIADEYLEVAKGLWDSWEGDARIENKETGEYVDRSKVHVLDHSGKYFTVRGPLGHSRSPQGRPVIVQAGSSASGQEFAAKHAEIVFTIQQEIEEARSFRDVLKSKVRAAGRPAEQCKVVPGLFTIVGRTEKEALDKLAMLRSFIKPGSALQTMSLRFGHDMSQYPMNGPMPELSLSTHGIQTYAKVMYEKAKRENLSLRDVHDLFALSRGYLLVSGTPESIADEMVEWFDSGACDGFILTPAYFPDGLNDFVNLVVPELQRRGFFRTDYTGSTLRDHLGLPQPANRFATALTTVERRLV